MFNPRRFPSNVEFSTQHWLREHDSGLAVTTFHLSPELCVEARGIPGRNYSTAAFIDHCCLKNKSGPCDPRMVLMTLQAEQSLACDRVRHDISCAITESLDPLPDTGVGRVLTTPDRKKWIRVIGDWRMMAACGAGIWPHRVVVDPHLLGFPSQLYHCAHWIGDYMIEWEQGKRVPFKDRVSDTLLHYIGEKWSGALDQGLAREQMLQQMFNV